MTSTMPKSRSTPYARNVTGSFWRHSWGKLYWRCDCMMSFNMTYSAIFAARWYRPPNWRSTWDTENLCLISYQLNRSSKTFNWSASTSKTAKTKSRLEHRWSPNTCWASMRRSSGIWSSILVRTSCLLICSCRFSVRRSVSSTSDLSHNLNRSLC